MQGYDERKEKRSADHSEVQFFTESATSVPGKSLDRKPQFPRRTPLNRPALKAKRSDHRQIP